MDQNNYPKGLKAVFSYLWGSLKKEYENFFEKYHSYDGPRGYLQTLDNLVEKHPFLVSLEEPGISTQGRIIPAVHLGFETPAKKKRFMITGMIHGTEFISGEVCLGILEQMIFDYENKKEDILEDAEIYFLPILNPDSFVYNIKKIKKGKHFGILKRANANNVDLNRNFDDNFHQRSWTTKIKLPIEYAGKYAFSEKESQFIRDFVKKYQINAVINFHSFMGKILYPPWSSKENNPKMKRTAQKMCDAMIKPYEAVQGAKVIEHKTKQFSKIATKFRHSTVEGTLDGWLYNQGIPSMLIEISKPSLPLAVMSFLYGFNPPPSSISFHVENCYRAAKVFIEEITIKST